MIQNFTTNYQLCQKSEKCWYLTLCPERVCAEAIHIFDELAVGCQLEHGVAVQRRSDFDVEAHIGAFNDGQKVDDFGVTFQGCSTIFVDRLNDFFDTLATFEHDASAIQFRNAMFDEREEIKNVHFQRVQLSPDAKLDERVEDGVLHPLNVLASPESHKIFVCRTIMEMKFYFPLLECSVGLSKKSPNYCQGTRKMKYFDPFQSFPIDNVHIQFGVGQKSESLTIEI